MTIPQIQETLGSINVELNRLQDVIADVKTNITELREQLGVERPELKATPATRSEEPESLMPHPYPTPRRGR